MYVFDKPEPIMLSVLLNQNLNPLATLNLFLSHHQLYLYYSLLF